MEYHSSDRSKSNRGDAQSHPSHGDHSGESVVGLRIIWGGPTQSRFLRPLGFRCAAPRGTGTSTQYTVRWFCCFTKHTLQILVDDSRREIQCFDETLDLKNRPSKIRA